ncbi:DUF4249 family protein [Cesiribacter andamanensis]|nr:DUF4249 family protein [Cesiribacter andamanensis]
MMHQEMEVELPPHAPITFIECYLDPEAPLRAIATNSLPFFDSLEISAADDLDIYLRQGQQEYKLQNGYAIDSVNRAAYNYQADDTVRYQEGEVWELVVWRQEEEIARGKSTFLSKPQIKNIAYTISPDSLLSLAITLKDNPATENFYRITILQGEEFGYNRRTFEGIWTDQFAEGEELTLHIGSLVRVWATSVCIRVDHLEEGYYSYLRSIEKANEANYNPFAQPANVESTLQGTARGIFTTISCTKEILVVDYGN